MIKEQQRAVASGYLMLAVVFTLFLASILAFVSSNASRNPIFLVLTGALLLMSAIFCSTGFIIVQPNTAVVLQLFGRYVGTAKAEGLHWANPFFTKRAVSLRVRNFETNRLKVNAPHIPTTRMSRTACRYVVTRPKSPPGCGRRLKTAFPSLASTWRNRVSATWPMRQKLPPPCCSASRLRRSSPHARRLWKGRSAWWKWRSIC